MKLLICTQAVDRADPILGFFHRWLEEFALHCEHIVVICQREGEHALPKNIEVLSLGKEKNASRLKQALHFLHYIIARRRDYEAVFVHMIPEYPIVGGFLWRWWHKNVMLWYTHKSVTWRLRLAVHFVDTVATASRESFRLTSKKVHIFGHGIDSEIFKPSIPAPSLELRIITAGRIGPSKQLKEMLLVLDELYKRGVSFNCTILGEPLMEGERLYTELFKKDVATRPFSNKIRFIGAVRNTDLPAFLNASDLFFNFSTTGSMDKAILEAMAVGLPPITSNEAFRTLLEPYGLWVSAPDARLVCDALERFMKRSDRSQISMQLRKEVVEHHALSRLVPAIIHELKQ